ncbi:HAMP domain-containing histidine kinase [Clostridium sp. SHJSY1]|uniref:sensor histidine kinase n=1 Tax=Clostridium sp. SHJSY1 TaxID=2942483 RepID=UPI0028770534|nr:HAMP domain-containing sensor histidine kinase [Clostridium sp. SHJSY1]MDS0526359.1 HAMP domain-containing histidine kinase [Clostridium sp. SHJSY1]
MKQKLSFKLFFITLGLLITLMATTLIFQKVFFQGFYEKQKQSRLVTEVSSFKRLYSFELSNSSGLLTAMKNLEEKTNSKVAILSSNGEFLTLPDKSNTPSSDNTFQIFFNILLNKGSLPKMLTKDQPIVETFDDDISGNRKIGVASSMSLNSKNDCFVIAIASIQPIQEASDVMSQFYVYIFIGFIFISIFLSSFYSNLISKPLIRLNNVALKMSKMDFNERCTISSQDEIGSLANTLNFLSSNLDNALKDLKEKNQKLEADIEKERSLELMRKDFIASVSHELKTPIGIIEGYAEGIKDGIVSGENTSMYLETIIDESKKMGVLVSNMLELSKLESGVIKPKFETFNINRLLSKLVKKHSVNAEENHLHIIFNESTAYSYVFADIFQMEQVLTNLITNAIKYTPENNDIVISICEEDDLYKISVLNKGSYIDPNELDKLFNKFYRVDKARQRVQNSTGLGLSIVKNLLELHNFKYSLANTHTGVEFKYYLPKATDVNN